MTAIWRSRNLPTPSAALVQTNGFADSKNLKLNLKCMLFDSEFVPSEKEFFNFLRIRFATVGIDFDEIEPYLVASLETSSRRFQLNKSKYFTSSDGRSAQFSATHYSSHALLLYQLSRECFLKGRRDLAEKIYFLNISTTATDLYYEVDLPLKTGCDHPLGSVIGRAFFGSKSSLFFRQNCNIGGNRDATGTPIYPEVTGMLYMHPRSSIIGECTVSGIVVLGNGVYAKDCGPLENVVVFGSSPDLTIRPITESLITQSSVFR